MAREGKAEDSEVIEEKLRPGTSGTENLLVTNRREARQHYQKAQQAEHLYRAKKRATAARRDFQDARRHFKESAGHLKMGVKLMFGAVKSAPYILGQKRDEYRKSRASAAKKKLEERLARQSGDPDADQTTETSESKGSSYIGS
ncbi:hypothetical protein ACO1O0_002944 [Amphichorda felina]